MGNLCYSHTYPIKVCPSGKPFLERCSFQAISLRQDQSCSVHAGKLMPDCTDLTVKIPARAADRTELACAAEVQKQQAAQAVLQQFLAGTKVIRVPRCLYAEVKKIGRGSEHVFDRTHGHDRIRRSDFVLILFLPPGSARDHQLLPADGGPNPILEAFAHASYHFSDGDFVLAGMRGTVQEQKGHARSYTLTSLTVHSRDGRFGSDDRKQDGIKGFFSNHLCTDLCKGMRMYSDKDLAHSIPPCSTRKSRTPRAQHVHPPLFMDPPPSYEEAMAEVLWKYPDSIWPSKTCTRMFSSEKNCRTARCIVEGVPGQFISFLKVNVTDYDLYKRRKT